MMLTGFRTKTVCVEAGLVEGRLGLVGFPIELITFGSRIIENQFFSSVPVLEIKKPNLPKLTDVINVNIYITVINYVNVPTFISLMSSYVYSLW